MPHLVQPGFLVFLTKPAADGILATKSGNKWEGSLKNSLFSSPRGTAVSDPRWPEIPEKSIFAGPSASGEAPSSAVIPVTSSVAAAHRQLGPRLQNGEGWRALQRLCQPRGPPLWTR